MWIYVISLSSFTMLSSALKVPGRLTDRDLENLCPGHTPYCNDSSNVRDSELLRELLPENQNHCCFCRCTDDCLHLGNCCPGKNRDIISGISEEGTGALFSIGAVCSGTLYSASYESFIDKVAAKAFMLVKTCDERFRDQEIIKRCLNASQLEIEEITPVHDSLHNVHYANRFCALCNYVETLENWRDYVLCYDIDLTLNNSQISARYLLMEITSTEGCAIWFEPKVNATECILDRNVINTCLYRTSADKCHSMPPNLYMSNGFVYKNLQCANCNHAFGAACWKDTLPLFMPTTFSALIEMSVKTENRPLKVDPRLELNKICGPHQIFSEIMNTCVQTYCPTFTERLNNQCDPVETPAGLTIEIQANIQYFTPQPSEENMVNAILESIVGNIPTTNLTLCSIQKLFQTSGEQGYIHHYVMSVLLEEPVFVHTLHESLIQALEIMNNKTGAEFQVKIQYNSELAVNEHHGNNSHLFNMFSNIVIKNCWQDTVAITELHFCKTVRIPSSLFTYTGMGITVNDTVFTYDEFASRIDKNYDIEYVEVCLDTFLNKPTQLVHVNPLVSDAFNLHVAPHACACVLSFGLAVYANF